jgi:predicted short-subunit dehydrogenase-like oxidoreductase (DUF2520 family)
LPVLPKYEVEISDDFLEAVAVRAAEIIEACKSHWLYGDNAAGILRLARGPRHKATPACALAGPRARVDLATVGELAKALANVGRDEPNQARIALT